MNFAKSLAIVLIFQFSISALHAADSKKEKEGTHMKGSHIHVKVKDLKNAVQWMDKILNFKPSFENDRMASISLGDFSVIFDAADMDTAATIAFDSQNCDEDFKKVERHGAEIIEKPTTKPYGVRAAYIKGPGQLTFEIEQTLPKKPL